MNTITRLKRQYSSASDVLTVGNSQDCGESAKTVPIKCFNVTKNIAIFVVTTILPFCKQMTPHSIQILSSRLLFSFNQQLSFEQGMILHQEE